MWRTSLSTPFFPSQTSKLWRLRPEECPDFRAGPGYEWAIVMLVVFLVLLLAGMICMFGLYVYNRIRDQRQRERILGSSSLRSSSISQVLTTYCVLGPSVAC